MLAAAAAAVALAPVRFPPRLGWRSGHGAVHACPGVPATRCESVVTWAATAPWRDCTECLPHRTTAHLPPDGVALQVSLARERPRRLAPHGWPPRIGAADVRAPFEGLGPRIGVYQLATVVDGFEVQVMVFFGRPAPTRAALAAVNAELRRARLP
jgi:hypothetical protein